MQKGHSNVFLCLQDFVASASVNTNELLTFESQHLKELPVSCGHYFPENANLRKGNFWIVNPFADDINLCDLYATKIIAS